jgi:putative transposase
MEIQKTIKIPVYYDTTQSKISIIDNLTARMTYCIRLISDLITEDTKLNRKTIRGLVKNSDVVKITGLSAGFVDQCIDKVIWSWKSYQRLHNQWQYRVGKVEERVASAKDDNVKEKSEKSLNKLLKREPSIPIFHNKTSCRLDIRTGKVEYNKTSKSVILWIHISTLKKGKTIDIPLNPSHYHINQLRNTEIKSFEIIKRNNKYYIHVTITKVIENKPISSIGGIDQGLNKSIAVVLLTEPFPHEGQILDSAKVELLEKYDNIVSSLQEAKKWDKLRGLRHKRENVSIYHDWCLANKVADFTEGSYIAIGNARFRQTQIHGNGMPTLRKRVGKWSYGRQRTFIALKRAERGYPTELRDEYGTSKECHCCGSMLTKRKFETGFSYILCYSCGGKIDADINAGYNIALRCRDDWLKAGMNMGETYASL